MRDLQEWIGQVPDAEVRPLVREAYRAYGVGAARAAIVLTWTAVCADLIGKIRQLHEQGEPDARALTEQVESAQGNLDSDAVHTMQQVEGSLLQTAVTLELIDATQKLQLERLREDRNLCAHPSLRPLGELFDPQPEYARAHLTVALDAVLVHPASQGRKVVDTFREHVRGTGFIGEPVHIAQVFYHRVRPAARRRVADFAAKHALLELPVEGIEAVELADRMAVCLHVFAAQDRDLVRDAIGRICPRLLTAQPKVQLRAAGRLGDLEAFWSGTDEALAGHLDALVRALAAKYGPAGWSFTFLDSGELRVLALAPDDLARAALPGLLPALTVLPPDQRAQVMNYRPGPYFAGHLAALMADVRTFDEGELVARTAVLPCAPHLTLSQHEELLTAWAHNGQCWGREMPGFLIEVFRTTAHLGDARLPAWRALLADLGSDSTYCAVIAGAIGEPIPRSGTGTDTER
ncbi:hypothetical protein OG900_10050 [Streptomyces sp. NBC_00433]